MPTIICLFHPSKNFEHIKAAVLDCFRQDAEEYRKRFRSTVVSSDETTGELCHRLRDLFDKWILHSMPAGTAVDVNSILDEVVREQLITTLPPPAQQHVRQQPKVSAADTAKLADAFMRSQPGADPLAVSQVAQRLSKPRRSHGSSASASSQATQHHSYSTLARYLLSGTAVARAL